MEWLPHGRHSARMSHRLISALIHHTALGNTFPAFRLHAMRNRKTPTIKLIQTLVVVSQPAVFAAPADARNNGNNNKARKNNDRALYKTEIQAMLGL
jgi:hypothetical protein